MARLSQLKYALNRASLCHREDREICGFHSHRSDRVQLGQSAALYCRVSTADQTCARQERDLRAFAKKAGYKIVGVWKETASGAKDDRAQRKEVLALAQARKIDVILVTELTRWGRSMLDRFHTLQDLQAWDDSLVAQTGLQFDLRSAQGKLIASLMAALAEFERDCASGFVPAKQPHASGVSSLAGDPASA
jgi:Resolvase, N terminal domain